MGDMKALLERMLAHVKSSEAQTDPYGCDCVEGYVRGEDGEWKLCPRCYERRKADEEMNRFRSRLREAGVAERYLDVDWGDLEMVPPFPQVRRVAGQIREFVRSGENFAFLGPPGTGKTQALALLAKAAVQAGVSVRLCNLSRLVIRVVSGRNGDSQFTEESVIEEFVRPQVLLLDDLGGGDGYRDLERRILYHVFEERAQKGLITGLSSNLSVNDPRLRELSNYLGAHVLERLRPLKVIRFDHGKNFRDRVVSSFWD